MNREKVTGIVVIFINAIIVANLVYQKVKIFNHLLNFDLLLIVLINRAMIFVIENNMKVLEN